MLTRKDGSIMSVKDEIHWEELFITTAVIYRCTAIKSACVELYSFRTLVSFLSPYLGLTIAQNKLDVKSKDLKRLNQSILRQFQRRRSEKINELVERILHFTAEVMNTKSQS